MEHPERPSAARARSCTRLVLVALALAAWPTGHARASGPMAFYAVEPCRVFDTRTGAQGGALVTNTLEPPPPAPPVASSVVRLFQVRGICSIPAEAAVVVYNLTIVAQPFPGHVTLYASGTNTPVASSLNFSANQTVANGGVAILGSANLDLAAKLVLGSAPLGSQAHLILDVTGYFAP
jgi:hypothetical protein